VHDKRGNVHALEKPPVIQTVPGGAAEDAPLAGMAYSLILKGFIPQTDGSMKKFEPSA
jgi:hypothetical protein